MPFLVTQTAGHDHSRFEVLPLRHSEKEAVQLPEPARLAVTCSPKHGPDRSVEVAERLGTLGHSVTVHVAARMVRDRGHLDELLAKMDGAGVDDVLLIGGDATPPQGPYSSAMELLPVIDEHPRRPSMIGIGGYPEGHPLIDSGRLAEALKQKSTRADYITTQLCFDPEAVIDWVANTRELGVTLPVLLGVPGVVDRGRLLKISMRIGVGPSRAFLRKQRGLRNILIHPTATIDRVFDALAPRITDPELNVIGLHYYTFNQLVDTWRWERQKQGDLKEAIAR